MPDRTAVPLTGLPDEPARSGVSVADIAGGMHACSGSPSALFAVETDGLYHGTAPDDIMPTQDNSS